MYTSDDHQMAVICDNDAQVDATISQTSSSRCSTTIQRCVLLHIDGLCKTSHGARLESIAQSTTRNLYVCSVYYYRHVVSLFLQLIDFGTSRS